MDFLDPKKKKAHRLRLYIGYGLMAVIVMTISVFLVFQAFGYNFNPRTGDITQNGLLFVDAHPEAADIYLNGQQEGTTDQRLVLPGGSYTLELRRDGYSSWQRDFTLEGGHIERYVYPFLFPENLETEQIQLYGAEPPFATQSPDRRWLLVQKTSSLVSFDLFDLNAETPLPASLDLPTNLLKATGTSHKLQLVEWSTDNRHVLIKHTFSGGKEFVLVDREEPAESVNLSVLFPSTPFTSLTLRDKRFDRYYLFDSSSKVLRSAVLDTRAVAVVLENVLQFHSHGEDVILYITPSKQDKNKVIATVLDDGTNYQIKELPAEDKYLLEVASFEGKWYMVAGAIGEDKIYVMRDPVSTLRTKADAKLVPAAILRIEGGQYVSFSNNARFIAVQSGSHFATYDAETDRIYRYETELKLPKNNKAVWMDGHRLTVSVNGKVTVFDYDGINRRTLVAAHPQFQPFFKQNYTSLFTLSPAPNLAGRTALLATSLVFEPAQ